MELPKLIYDDFYKFLVSFGAILLITSGAGVSIQGFSWWFVLTIVVGISIMMWAGNKWYKNQRSLDKRLENEVKLTDIEISKIIRQDIAPDDDKEPLRVSRRRRKSVNYKTKEKSNTAIVSYKIASSLPNSVSFDFLKDGKVWFWIANHEKKKYLAYIKIKFFIDDNVFLELNDGYYGATKAWNLNALSGIQAPGLGIPEDVKEAAKQNKNVKIEINCSAHDEFDNFIEKKLPQTYVYHRENNNWFLEP